MVVTDADGVLPHEQNRAQHFSQHPYHAKHIPEGRLNHHQHCLTFCSTRALTLLWCLCCVSVPVATQAKAEATEAQLTALMREVEILKAREAADKQGGVCVCIVFAVQATCKDLSHACRCQQSMPA
jgi:hypothetical protein